MFYPLEKIQILLIFVQNNQILATFLSSGIHQGCLEIKGKGWLGKTNCLQIEADQNRYAAASLTRHNPNIEFLPNQPGAKWTNVVHRGKAKKKEKKKKSCCYSSINNIQ